jgi:hypothetical protein
MQKEMARRAGDDKEKGSSYMDQSFVLYIYTATTK